MSVGLYIQNKTLVTDDYLLQAVLSKFFFRFLPRLTQEPIKVDSGFLSSSDSFESKLSLTFSLDTFWDSACGTVSFDHSESPMLPLIPGEKDSELKFTRP